MVKSTTFFCFEIEAHQDFYGGRLKRGIDGCYIFGPKLTLLLIVQASTDDIDTFLQH